MSTWNAIRVCLQSRALISLLAIGADLLLPDHNADAYRHDLAADRQNSSSSSSSSSSSLDHAILAATNAFTRWDAQYFIKIAYEGNYAEEKMLAFFPMFPFTIRAVSRIIELQHFLPLNRLAALAFAAYFVNLAAFVVAGIFLSKLTHEITRSKSAAARVVQFFAYNPASIFFTAFYTESLFCCVTFAALYALYRFRSPTIAAILFALGIFTRSNGIVSFGYIIFYQLIVLSVKLRSSTNRFSLVFTLLRIALHTAFCGIICLMPLLAYLVIAWEEFCDYRYMLHKTAPEWCDSRHIPFPYQSVQTKYWEVGFLRYYQVKKIPNFLMAAPALTLVFASIARYMVTNFTRIKRMIQSLFRHDRIDFAPLIEPIRAEKDHNPIDLFAQPCLLPFALHSLFLAIVCALFMHIEVATRFLFSASPWPYWALLHFTTEPYARRKLICRLVSLYQFTYFVIGTICFVNFLPFT